MRRALDAARPRFFIAIETELWPNFLRALARRRIPAMIANGRISDRSFRRYRWVRGLMRRVLANVSVFAMQTEEDARRIIALGAPPARVVVTGNLKSDLVPDAGDEDAAAWRERLRLGADARLWIAGSTHRGEEALVLDAYLRARARCPDLALLLAPRHPERAGRGRGADPRARPGRGPPQPAARRRRRPARSSSSTRSASWPPLYALAEVVFVGGSLVPIGGHNVLEPAMRGKPVLVGPHMSNFREGAELLQRSGGGLVVKDGLELERELTRLLEDRELARRMGEAARQAFAGRQGAVSATLDLVGQPPVAAARTASRHDDPAPGARGAAAPVLGRSGHPGGDGRPLRAQPGLPRPRCASATWPIASRSCAPAGCPARWSRSAISRSAAAARPRRWSSWCARCRSWARCPRW